MESKPVLLSFLVAAFAFAAPASSQGLVEVDRLAGSSTPAGSQFGIRVAASEGLLAVATRSVVDVDAVHLFTRDGGGTWQETARIEAPVPGTRFGEGLALSSQLLVVGAPDEDQTGVAYVYELVAGIPVFAAQLFASDAGTGDAFGQGVGVAGDEVFVGAPFHDHPEPNSGAVYVFGKDAGGPNSWGEVRELVSPHGTSRFFGQDLDVSGRTLVVGADGPAEVFERAAARPGAWMPNGSLPSSGTFTFGRAVAVTGNTAVVGDTGYPNGIVFGILSLGSAHVYRSGAPHELARTGGWSKVKRIRPVSIGLEFAKDVAALGDLMAVVDPGAVEISGQVVVHQRGPGGAWSQAGTASSISEFQSVAIAGDEILAGAPYEDGFAGAVLVYRLLSPEIALQGSPR